MIYKLLRIARPQFLVSGMALFVFGVCWAVLLGAPFALMRIVLGYLVLMPAHLSISYSNDYFDVGVDRYGKPTLVSGGSGMLTDDPGLRAPARRVAIGLMGLSLVFGILFQRLYSTPAWFLGLVVVGNLAGWFYSAPPLKLAYRGLGEVAMMFSIGVLIPGLGYLVTRGQLDLQGLLFIVPLMLLGLTFILAVEIPDMEMDRLGDKRNWVARRGRKFGFTAIAAALLLASLFFLVFPWISSQTYPVDFRVLGTLTLLPLAAGLVGWIKRPMEKEAATHMVYGIMSAFAIFCLLADGYMIFLVYSQLA